MHARRHEVCIVSHSGSFAPPSVLRRNAGAQAEDDRRCLFVVGGDHLQFGAVHGKPQLAHLGYRPHGEFPNLPGHWGKVELSDILARFRPVVPQQRAREALSDNAVH